MVKQLRQATDEYAPPCPSRVTLDLESLGNPGKDKDYGSERALQYGVSGVAEGASDHFFSADTRVVFGVNALEIGLVELYDTGFLRCVIWLENHTHVNWFVAEII